MFRITLSRFVLALLALLCTVFITSCGSGDTRSDGSGPDERLKIVATIGMVGDLVRAVAGDDAQVSVLIGEGIDPHLYSPTRQDVVRLQEADAIFYNGLLLEGNLGTVLNRLSTSRKTFAVSEQVIASGEVELLFEEDGERDPHLWMDPQAWTVALDKVTDALVSLKIAPESTLRARAEAYRAELAALDAYASENIASIPEAQRVLITAHDAFGYLGRRYDLEVRGIQGISTDAEAGLREIEQLVRFIVDQKIPAVFVESTIADRSVRALIEGARARGATVRIGGSLFSDAMGQAGSYEGTYLGMIDHNITTIVRALGGEAPERGRLGKLGADE